MKDNLWLEDNLLADYIKYDDVDILSLDIFDTLIIRACDEPSDIFKFLAERGKKDKIINQDIFPEDFCQIRIIAEKEARKTKEEINLNDIYMHMPDRLGNISAIKEMELEMEKKYCYLNPSIYSLIKYMKQLDKRVILVSDMYLNIEYMIDLLEVCGVDLKLLDKIFVSNEYKCSKLNGNLFRKVCNTFDRIEPQRILHIGDNHAADINGASLLGIKTIHYNKLYKKDNDVLFYERIKFNGILDNIKSLRVLASNSYANIPLEKKDWFDIGANVVGPFFVSFCDWVVQECMKNNTKYIYPLMREGDLFCDIFIKIINYRKLDIIVRPLYVSRNSTWLPSIIEFKKPHLDSLFKRRNFKISNLFDLLGLKIDKRFNKYNNLCLSQTNQIFIKNNQTLQSEIYNFILQEEIVLEINKNIDKQRTYFQMYLDQEIPSFENIATVDLGYGGTIQNNIELFLESNQIASNINHYIAMGSERLKQHLLKKNKIISFTGLCQQNLDLIKIITLEAGPLEQLTMGKIGSTLSYKFCDKCNKVTPILDDNIVQKIPEEEFVDKAYARSGILKFLEFYLYLTDRKLYLRNILLYQSSRDWCKLLYRLFDMPTPIEAELLGSLHHEDNFGSKNIESFCDDYNYSELQEDMIEQFMYKCANIYKYRNDSKAYWMQGIVTRKYPNYFFDKEIRNRSYFDREVRVINIIKHLKGTSNINQLMIYGAGNVGVEVLRYCRIYGIEVKYFVDRKESLWKTKIEDIEIISIKDAVTKRIDNIIIGSFAFTAEIQDTIKINYEDKPINIISLFEY